MKESTIKREVRNLDDVTTEIVTLDKGWLYTAVHRSPESDTIETQYIEEKEEIIKLRRKEIWEKAEILEKEEIEVSYDDEEIEKKNYKNKVDKKGNQIDIKTTVSKAKGNVPYIDCRSMVKFDEKDGLIFKTANLVSSKTLNIPRGIFPLKNLVIEKGKMAYWFYNPFDNINELKDVDKSIFLYNVYSTQLLQSFSKAHREPPISVSTLVKIFKDEKYDDTIVIRSDKEKGVKVTISKKEDLSFEVSVERFGERLDVSFDTKNEDILFRVIRSFLAYIGLGLDDIDLLTLKTLGIRINPNDSKDNIIYIKKYTKFIVKENRMEETILLENVKTKF